MFKGIIKNENKLIEHIYSKQGVIIYGNGTVGQLLKNNLDYILYDKKHGKNVVLAATSVQDKTIAIITDGSERAANQCIEISQAIKLYPDYDVIIATVVDDNIKSMTSFLMELNENTNYFMVSIDYYSEQQQRNSIEMHKNKTERLMDQLIKKLSMIDDIWQNDNIKFYVPNYPLDYIQRTIVDNCDFFEISILKKLEQYIPDNAVIFDIGSNIGNHTIYWAKIMNAQKIYAFEPVKQTYDILQKNLKLNRIEEKVTAFNCGLSDIDGNADFLSFQLDSIGSTSIVQKDDGEMKVNKLDSMPFICDIDKVDFVKIDVEGFEINVLKGMEQFLKKYKPVVFIESFPDNAVQTIQILNSYGFTQECMFDDINYLFKFIRK